MATLRDENRRLMKCLVIWGQLATGVASNSLGSAANHEQPEKNKEQIRVAPRPAYRVTATLDRQDIETHYHVADH